MYTVGTLCERDTSETTHSYVSNPSVAGTFSKAQAAVVGVEHADVATCRVHHRVIVRGTYVEKFGRAVVTKRMA